MLGKNCFAICLALSRYCCQCAYADGAEQLPTNSRQKIVFSDIVGFTTITDRLEPERLAQMMTEYFKRWLRSAMGSTLDQFIGDAIVISLVHLPLREMN